MRAMSHSRMVMTKKPSVLAREGPVGVDVVPGMDDMDGRQLACRLNCRRVRLAAMTKMLRDSTAAKAQRWLRGKNRRRVRTKGTTSTMSQASVAVWRLALVMRRGVNEKQTAAGRPKKRGPVSPDEDDEG